MHLLAATPGAIDDGSEPVDLGQTPADVMVISAADTELAALSEARSEMEDAPTLRLASMMHLQHPMSVDLHIEACAVKSRLVIVRALGGAGYWRYGVEQYAAHLHEAGVPFALLPGDDKLDPELRELSTVSSEDYDALWAYLVEGGPENAANFLRYTKMMLDGGEAPMAASPLLRAGVYWPGAGVADIAAATEAWTEGAPVVPLVFYRALVQGAGLNPMNRLVKALLREGLNPLPIFVASLKDPVSVATLERLFEAAPPSVILNCTSFAVGSAHGDDGPANPLAMGAANGAPVFQVVFSGSTEAAWDEGLTGLSARDIAMNVALPEVDGRVLTRAVSFKGEAFFDEATECPIATYRARGGEAPKTGSLVGYNAVLSIAAASAEACLSLPKTPGAASAKTPTVPVKPSRSDSDVIPAPRESSETATPSGRPSKSSTTRVPEQTPPVFSKKISLLMSRNRCCRNGIRISADSSAPFTVVARRRRSSRGRRGCRGQPRDQSGR